MSVRLRSVEDKCAALKAKILAKRQEQAAIRRRESRRKAYANRLRDPEKERARIKHWRDQNPERVREHHRKAYQKRKAKRAAAPKRIPPKKDPALLREAAIVRTLRHRNLVRSVHEHFTLTYSRQLQMPKEYPFFSVELATVYRRLGTAMKGRTRVIEQQ